MNVMRQSVVLAAVLAATQASFGGTASAADDKDEKQVGAVYDQVKEFTTAFAGNKIDDAMKAVGTPFAYGRGKAIKVYKTKQEVQALFKQDAPGPFMWDSKDVEQLGPGGTSALKAIAALKLNVIKPAATSVLGKNDGHLTIYSSGMGNSRSAYVLTAIKDGKPVVVGLIFQE